MFPGFGSVGGVKKKITRNNLKKEAWNTSTIAVQPENNKAWSPNRHQLNMAENMMVNFILKKRSKKGKKQKGYTT